METTPEPQGLSMMMDPHNLQLPFFCLLWKAAPNILWSLGGAAHNQFLQVRRDNPAIMAARLWLMSLLGDYCGLRRTSKQVDANQVDSLARLDYRTPQ
jgi:hypothetical protein